MIQVTLVFTPSLPIHGTQRNCFYVPQTLSQALSYSALPSLLLSLRISLSGVCTFLPFLVICFRSHTTFVPFQFNRPFLEYFRPYTFHRASPRVVSFHAVLISLTNLAFKQAKKTNPLPRGWPPRFLGAHNCKRHSTVILFPATFLRYDKPTRMSLCSPPYLT